MKKFNWSVDFLELVASRKDAPFVWGENDCVLFAADAVVVMGNPDPAAKSRGKYKTETGAKKHLVSAYGSLEEAWDASFDRLENINYVQNGDIVLFDGGLGSTSAVYWNGGLFVTTPEGVKFMDEMHKNILMAWRV